MDPALTEPFANCFEFRVKKNTVAKLKIEKFEKCCEIRNVSALEILIVKLFLQLSLVIIVFVPLRKALRGNMICARRS